MQQEARWYMWFNMIPGFRKGIYFFKSQTIFQNLIALRRAAVGWREWLRESFFFSAFIT